MYEIGNEFSYVIPSDEQDFRELFREFRNVAYVRSGREGLGYIADDICGQRGEKPSVLTAFLPALCAPEMLGPFKARDIEIKFYPLKKDLKIDTDFLEKAVKGVTYPVIVTMCHFGCVDHKQETIRLKNAHPEVTIVEDVTHILYSPMSYDPSADYIVGSIRKWMPLPDGAVVIKRNAPFAKELKADLEPTKFTSLRENALLLKTSYLRTGDPKTKEVYVGMLKQAEESLDDGATVHKISKTAEQILTQARVVRISSRRSENYHNLYQMLQQMLIDLGDKNKKASHAFRLLPEVSDKIVPLMLPVVLTPDIDRDKVRKDLAARGIYTQIQWRIADGQAKAGSAAADISSHMLSFWIDQRYDRYDMEHTTEVFKEVLLKHCKAL